MPTQLELLAAQALKLSPEGRSRLADQLITSLFDDQDVEAAWATEVDRRIAEIESGRATMVPAADAVARARSALE